MSDQNFREIQLGGKQLVFLFMAAVVISVAIFLLGISVGRGVRTATGEASSGTDVAVAQTGAPVDMPPPTETTPADLRYHEQLQGLSTPPAGAPAGAAAKSAEPPSPVADAPPAVEEPKPAATAAGRTTGAPQKPQNAATAPAAAKAADKAPAKPDVPLAASGDAWFVQVSALRSRANADRQAQQLRGKGYSGAAVSSVGQSGLFHVRIGPFAERAEADKVADRLRREERLTPSVQR